MCHAMDLTKNNGSDEDDGNNQDSQYQKGVKHLYERGINSVPTKYILPVEERPNLAQLDEPSLSKKNLELPIIDFAELQGSNRLQVLNSLANACEQYGFFQVVNHGILADVINSMIDASTRFFELPYEERSKYMSSDMRAQIRYGTSFNQSKDNVFCWRDFLKIMCNTLSDVLPHLPSSLQDFRELVATYTKETNHLFVKLMEAILESLLLGTSNTDAGNIVIDHDDREEVLLDEFGNGSQLMVVNCFPPCPEPELTLGMPPHSDYGFLTLLLQGQVQGLQIQYKEKWFTVEPIANAFVVNVGDHLEIFSNGRYKSVVHRVIVNSTKSRISVATLHSLQLARTVRPWSRLINEANPRKYKDADFASFLDYISSRDTKKKEFLETMKLVTR